MDTTKKFTGRAIDYVKGRPAYAEAFLRSLTESQNLSSKTTIADVGCGTGKLAQQLLLRGCRVYGIEPNKDMRTQACKALSCWPEFYAVEGTAENTTLKSASVDLITCAQAFHWFDGEKFAAECRRILRPGGKVFLIWNLRDLKADINRVMYELYASCCPGFTGFGGGIQMNDERILRFFSSDFKYEEYDHPLFYSMEDFVSRSLSGSYSLKEGDLGYQEYLHKIRSIFRRFERNGIVEMPNKTVIYSGTVFR